MLAHAFLFCFSLLRIRLRVLVLGIISGSIAAAAAATVTTTITTAAAAAASIQATHGRVRHFIHLYFNYHEIYSRIPTSPPQRKLYVIRKEHLWDDWWKVNRMFGEHQRRESIVPASGGDTLRNITGIQLPVTRDISDEARSKLCKALEQEYSVYFRILQRAENMDAEDLKDARRFASGNCPNLDFRSILADSETH